jgi:putative tricarboxylic transport membrane protein
MSTLMRRGEILSGAALAALGLFVGRESLRWEVLNEAGPGPGFFPLVYGVLMVILSVVLILRAAAARPVPGAEDQLTNWRGIVAALTVWVAFVATIPLMSYFGFLIAVGLLMAFVTRFIYARSIRYSVAAAILTPALYYAIFTKALQVRLPVGSLTGF